MGIHKLPNPLNPLNPASNSPFTLDWLYTIPENAFNLNIKDYLLMVEAQLEALHQTMYNRARSEYLNRHAAGR